MLGSQGVRTLARGGHECTYLNEEEMKDLTLKKRKSSPSRRYKTFAASSGDSQRRSSVRIAASPADEDDDDETDDAGKYDYDHDRADDEISDRDDDDNEDDDNEEVDNPNDEDDDNNEDEDDGDDNYSECVIKNEDKKSNKNSIKNIKKKDQNIYDKGFINDKSKIDINDLISDELVPEVYVYTSDEDN